ncbi:MAG: hypothetical protein AAFQ10_03400 [Pseudomonadota bacterium]
MQLIVQAARARRRCDHRFAKGQNGPFDQEEFTDDEWETIDGDEYLSVRPYRDDDGEVDGPKNRNKAKPSNRGSSAAARRAAKKKQAELDKALAAIPEGTEPTPESVKAAGGPDVTEAEIAASLKAAQSN